MRSENLVRTLVVLVVILISTYALSRARQPGSSICDGLTTSLRVKCLNAAQRLRFSGQPANRVRLTTPWSKDVNKTDVLPEYPRPQMQRDDWLNLNGEWEFECTGAQDQPPPAFGRTLKDKILVPFPAESDLSGLSIPDGQAVHMVYRTMFEVPDSWSGQEVLLHFGAVDYEARVYVNEMAVGTHRGGYNKFAFDISKALKPGPSDASSDDSSPLAESAQNELVVEVWDPTDTANIPIGKQRMFPGRPGIFYTASSGIWKTVWLEPVPKAHITNVHFTTDVPSSSVTINVTGSESAGNQPFRAVISTDNNAVTAATVCGRVGEATTVAMNGARLWSPDDPFLYDVDVSLLDESALMSQQLCGDESAADESAMHESAIEEFGSKVHTWLKANLQDSFKARPSPRQQDADSSNMTHLVSATSQAQPMIRHQLRETATQQFDSVRSYFGVRSVGLGPVGPGGHLRPLINGKFIFHIGMLDQGYWPDGLYTAPTEEAMVSDLILTKQLGFNTLRKHIKVEPDRWYYHADRMGILVWQDTPSWWAGHDASVQSTHQPTEEEKEQYESEMVEMIQEHKHFPCIVNWVVFNEGWGQYDTERITKLAMSLDDTRLFDCASGWVDAPVGNLIDMHKYVGPGSPGPTATRAAVLGEFGGLGLRVDGHRFMPERDFSYELLPDGLTLQNRYLGLVEGLKHLLLSPTMALSGAIYTELTDAEVEINGWITYDRRVVKVDASALQRAHKELIALSLSLNED